MLAPHQDTTPDRDLIRSKSCDLSGADTGFYKAPCLPLGIPGGWGDGNTAPVQQKQCPGSHLVLVSRRSVAVLSFFLFVVKNKYSLIDDLTEQVLATK